MKLSHILEARHHANTIGPVKLWSFKADGPGMCVGIEQGYDSDADVYVEEVDGYTEEDGECEECIGSGEDDDGDECEDCGGSGECEWDGFGDQWQVGYVLGTKENVKNSFHFEKTKLESEGEELFLQIKDNEDIPQHLRDGIYKG